MSHAINSDKQGTSHVAEQLKIPQEEVQRLKRSNKNISSQIFEKVSISFLLYPLFNTRIIFFKLKIHTLLANLASTFSFCFPIPFLYAPTGITVKRETDEECLFTCGGRQPTEKDRVQFSTETHLQLCLITLASASIPYSHYPNPKDTRNRWPESSSKLVPALLLLNNWHEMLKGCKY
ncbi:hypothetical protein HHI36_014802 [Cryptolaemus montrouzieri]|uniref:Uncharacterized protein n=1 Tax=Cryptolaemus montrouzieri TaxID=559131 RepID=A0ABD2N3Z7_9CUCU